MNLIITCARHLEPEAEEEIKEILKEFGDSETKVSITNMSGILTAETSLEPIQVVRKMKEMLLDEPWSIRYCLRVIPIQKVIETKIEEIEKTITYISEQISDDETYRISIETLDKVVLIEILGNKAGISVLKKSDVLSTEKTKRSISE